MAINNKKYIKTSIKIIYVSDFFYCQKSKKFIMSVTLLLYRISFIWCEMCFVMLLETKPKIR